MNINVPIIQLKIRILIYLNLANSFKIISDECSHYQPFCIVNEKQLRNGVISKDFKMVPVRISYEEVKDRSVNDIEEELFRGIVRRRLLNIVAIFVARVCQFPPVEK